MATPIDDLLLDIVELRPSRLQVSPNRVVEYIVPSDADSLGLNAIVQYSEEGVPEDIRHDLLVAYLLPVLKTYRARITVLENRLEVAMALVDDAHAKLAKLVGDKPS